MLIAGVAFLSLSLRSFASVPLQKLGTLGILATSFLIGWLLTGYWPVGLALAASWLLLPWLEILTRVRRLKMPVERALRQKAAPGTAIFPDLPELSREIKDEGFEDVDDLGWDWEDYQQFFRLFYKADERTQAAICMVAQQNVTFFYLSLSSRAKDGQIWTTWNYPFSYSLKLAPQWRVNRVRGAQSMLELFESHRSFLLRNGVDTGTLEPMDAAQIQAAIACDLRAQISHNLAAGVLTLATPSSSEVRYSWRGLVFIWIQFVRDLLRLS